MATLAMTSFKNAKRALGKVWEGLATGICDASIYSSSEVCKSSVVREHGNIHKVSKKNGPVVPGVNPYTKSPKYRPSI